MHDVPLHQNFVNGGSEQGPSSACFSDMDKRDWELLEKRMRRSSPPRNDGIVGLTVAAVFLAGMALGGVLLAHENGPTRPAWNNVQVATFLLNGLAPTTSQ